MNKNSIIVVTGGKGFLGQALVERLRASGYTNVNTFSSLQFNLTSQSSAEQMFFYYNPEVVIHLAARVGGIGANLKNPGKFGYENLVMGANVVELSRKYGVKKLITAGTVCAYPEVTNVPFKEEDLWLGYPEPTNAPYGLAKKMLLVLSQAYRQQYGCNFTYLLPVNLYGPRDSFDLENSHVIPAMIRKFHEAKERGEEKVTLWGDGSPSREFLYVDDCAEAFVSAMESYDGSDPVNIGSNTETSMKDLAETVKKIVRYNGCIEWDTSRPNGQPRRCLDVSKAKELLSWSARTSLEEGLQKTYDWYLRETANVH